MKFMIIFLFLLQPVVWEHDFESAAKKAKEQHKLILLNFSGSDWCGPCILMKKDYFENIAFQNVAGDLILVNADFPRKKKNALPAEQIKQNAVLAEKYNKEGSFPLTLLLNADGKILKSWSGKPNTTPDQWTQELKKACDANH
jgi:thiol-disulfide isomerase/thioredoxin